MKTTNNFLDRILPTFGNPRENIPIYCDSQKMFLSSHYTSDAGNMYYKGLRFTDRLVMIEKVGLYKNFSYIDSIEIYAFDGETKILIGKTDYNKTFYDSELIRNDAKTIVAKYLQGSSQISGVDMESNQTRLKATELVNQMYENPMRSAMSLRGAYKQLLLSE